MCNCNTLFPLNEHTRTEDLFIHSSVDGGLGCFQSFAVMQLCSTRLVCVCVSWRLHAAVYLGSVRRTEDPVLHCLATLGYTVFPFVLTGIFKNCSWSHYYISENEMSYVYGLQVCPLKCCSYIVPLSIIPWMLSFLTGLWKFHMF